MRCSRNWACVEREHVSIRNRRKNARSGCLLSSLTLITVFDGIITSLGPLDHPLKICTSPTRKLRLNIKWSVTEMHEPGNPIRVSKFGFYNPHIAISRMRDNINYRPPPVPPVPPAPPTPWSPCFSSSTSPFFGFGFANLSLPKL
jgi:hypothetical protein